MRKFSAITIACALLLSACSAPPASVQPAPSNPVSTDPAPTNPTANYPYNPDANAVQSKDTRVPYYGEWVWVVKFSDDSTFSGKMSIAVKADEKASLKNFGGGASEWCLDDLDSCRYSGDVGLIGTLVNDGTFLSASHFDTTADSLKWLGLDADGKVGTEVGGKPTIAGIGKWYFASGGDANVGFALVQASTNPPIKPKSVVALPKNFSAQMLPKSGLSSQAASDLQARAIAAASALVAGR